VADDETIADASLLATPDTGDMVAELTIWPAIPRRRAGEAERVEVVVIRPAMRRATDDAATTLDEVTTKPTKPRRRLGVAGMAALVEMIPANALAMLDPAISADVVEIAAARATIAWVSRLPVTTALVDIAAESSRAMLDTGDSDALEVIILPRRRATVDAAVVVEVVMTVAARATAPEAARAYPTR